MHGPHQGEYRLSSPLDSNFTHNCEAYHRLALSQSIEVHMLSQSIGVHNHCDLIFIKCHFKKKVISAPPSEPVCKHLVCIRVKWYKSQVLAYNNNNYTNSIIIIIPVVVSFNYTAMIWIDLGRALKDLFLSQIEFYLTFMEFHGIILLNRALFHYI